MQVSSWTYMGRLAWYVIVVHAAGGFGLIDGYPPSATAARKIAGGFAGRDGRDGSD